jgi:hypothetical protein
VTKISVLYDRQEVAAQRFLFLLQKLTDCLPDGLCNSNGLFFASLLQAAKGIIIQTDAETHIFWFVRFWTPCARAHGIASFLSRNKYNICVTKSQALFPKIFHVKIREVLDVRNNT